MPNCFQLTPKASPQNGPELLQTIDEKMCAFFEQPCHPEKWFCYWYDMIGFRLAMGKTFEQIKEYIATEYGTDDMWYKITVWLDEHYTTDSWVEIGRRS